jgi:hypothetical protein
MNGVKYLKKKKFTEEGTREKKKRRRGKKNVFFDYKGFDVRSLARRTREERREKNN